jgi:hypothetical protein
VALPLAVRGLQHSYVRSDDSLLRNCADLHLGIDSLDSESDSHGNAHQSLKTTFDCRGLSYGSSYLSFVFSKPGHRFSEVAHQDRNSSSHLGRLSTLTEEAEVIG